MPRVRGHHHTSGRIAIAVKEENRGSKGDHQKGQRITTPLARNTRLTMADSVQLPAGMWFYSFMFDDRHLLPGHVEAGRLPTPSSLAAGVAVGAALTAVRFALDFAVFKVRRRIWRWSAFG